MSGYGEDRSMDRMYRVFEQMAAKEELLRQEQRQQAVIDLQRSRETHALNQPWMQEMVGNLRSGPMAAGMEFAPPPSGQRISQGAYDGAGTMAPAVGLRAPPTHPMDGGQGRMGMDAPAAPAPSQGPPQGIEAGPNWDRAVISRTPMGGGAPSAMLDDAPIPYPAGPPIVSPPPAYVSGQPLVQDRRVMRTPPAPQRLQPRTPEQWEIFKSLQGQQTQLDITRESTTNKAAMEVRKAEAKGAQMQATLAQKLLSDLNKSAMGRERDAAAMERTLVQAKARATGRQEKQDIDQFRRRYDSIRGGSSAVANQLKDATAQGLYAHDAGTPGRMFYDRLVAEDEAYKTAMLAAQDDYEARFAESIGGTQRPTPERAREVEKKSLQEMDLGDIDFESMDPAMLRELAR